MTYRTDSAKSPPKKAPKMTGGKRQPSKPSEKLSDVAGHYENLHQISGQPYTPGAVKAK